MTDLTVETLTALSPAQMDALEALHVSDRQAFQGKSFGESLEDWRCGAPREVLGLCFLHQDELVGMTVFRRAETAEGTAATATVHGLKIATPWQGRGWGHQAFHLAVRRLTQDWPDVSTLKLEVDADNHAAIAIYRAFGMTDSGPVHHGKHGPEHHMEIGLSP